MAGGTWPLSTEAPDEDGEFKVTGNIDAVTLLQGPSFQIYAGEACEGPVLYESGLLLN